MKKIVGDQNIRRGVPMMIHKDLVVKNILGDRARKGPWAVGTMHGQKMSCMAQLAYDLRGPFTPRYFFTTYRHKGHKNTPPVSVKVLLVDIFIFYRRYPFCWVVFVYLQR